MTDLENLVQQYKSLLNEKSKEQVYQNFIEENSQFLPRHFIQNHGIHFQLFIRKLPLSSEYKTDFFYMAKSSISWNYILIEIEKPQSKFFKDGTKNFHSDFNHALEQINNWKAWFADVQNKEAFESKLSFLKKPISEAKVNIKYILVFGRRDELKNKILSNKVYTNETDDFKIMTFDSLMEDISNKNQLYRGVLKSDFLEISSEKLIDPNVFNFLEAHDVRLTSTLKDLCLDYFTDLKKNRPNKLALSLASNIDQDIIDKIKKIKTFKK